jgi:hypothetical protein
MGPDRPRLEQVGGVPAGDRSPLARHPSRTLIRYVARRMLHSAPHLLAPIADEDPNHIGPFLERFIGAATPSIEGGLR